MRPAGLRDEQFGSFTLRICAEVCAPDFCLGSFASCICDGVSFPDSCDTVATHWPTLTCAAAAVGPVVVSMLIVMAPWLNGSAWLLQLPWA